ncbi:choice-of-anchor B family protein [Kaarinaea lacus]
MDLQLSHQKIVIEKGYSMKTSVNFFVTRKIVVGCLLFFGLLGASSVYAAENCVNNSANGFPCYNIDLLSHVSLSDMQAYTGNDVWGWTDPETGKEYVLFGHSTGVSFIDISDPENPAILGQLSPRVPNPNPRKSSDHDWRDIKVYADHAYIISEAEGTGLQVFDLRQLRGLDAGDRVFASTFEYAGFGHAHNIVMNTDSGYAYVVGSFDCGAGGLLAFDLSNPQIPVFSGCFFADTYTHDSQCVNYRGPDQDHKKTEICVNSNSDYYFDGVDINNIAIVDVTDKAQPVEISRINYPDPRYAHQGWLTEDHSYFLFNDESDEWYYAKNTRTLIFDVRDLDNPVFIGEHLGETRATDHNLYVHNGLVYEANYTSGLSVLSTDEIEQGSLSEIGFFDVYPENNERSFIGAWSVYPFFASGAIVVSSIDRGLFVLRLGSDRGGVPASARKTPGQKNRGKGGN